MTIDPTPDPELVERVAERLHIVRQRITAAGGSGVQVLAVTKSFSISEVFAAVAAGCDGIGENYAQEAIAKLAGIARPFELHFIGQLQTNKIRALAGLVDVFETVDRQSVVTELAKRLPGARVLVQVAPPEPAGDMTGATTGATTGAKGGCRLQDAMELIEAARAVGLRVEGLMTVGPTEGGPEAARPGFRAVRTLADRAGLATVSMGMTHDLEVAVQEGATQVRVGSALFGDRPPRA